MKRGQFGQLWLVHPCSLRKKLPHKRAHSDLEAFWLWPLQPAYSQNWAGSYVLDLTSHIQYCSILPKKARLILCKTDPNPIWMAWSHFDQMHLVQKQASVQEPSGSVLAEHNWSATTFPLSGTRLHSSIDGPSYCAKSAQNLICFCLTGSGSDQTGLAQMQATVKESSGPLLANASEHASDVNQIQHVYWVIPALILGVVSVTTSSQPDSIKHCHT